MVFQLQDRWRDRQLFLTFMNRHDKTKATTYYF